MPWVLVLPWQVLSGDR